MSSISNIINNYLSHKLPSPKGLYLELDTNINAYLDCEKMPETEGFIIIK